MHLLPETIQQLSADTTLSLQQDITYELLVELLAQKLEDLVCNNFQQFVLLLYKVDVAEDKVSVILASDLSPDVYRKIAVLLIERQQQKIISRKTFKQPDGDDGEEKW